MINKQQKVKMFQRVMVQVTKKNINRIIVDVFQLNQEARLTKKKQA